MLSIFQTKSLLEDNSQVEISALLLNIVKYLSFDPSKEQYHLLFSYYYFVCYYCANTIIRIGFINSMRNHLIRASTEIETITPNDHKSNISTSHLHYSFIFNSKFKLGCYTQ